MTISQQAIDQVLYGKIRPDMPLVSIPDALRLFAPTPMSEADAIAFWEGIDIVKLRAFLELTRDGSVEGGIEFHRSVGDHIESLLPYVSSMSDLLHRDPDASDAEKARYKTCKQNLLKARIDLAPEAFPPPIALQLNLPRKAKKNKSEGKARKAPLTSMAIAIPFLELLNGVITQEFHEEELSGVIAEITGYSSSNISNYRRKRLTRPQRQVLINVLQDMIHSLEG